MDLGFIASMVGTGFGAAMGGFAAYVAMKVNIALTMQSAATALNTANEAKESASKAHNRITDHVEYHHTRRGRE